MDEHDSMSELWCVWLRWWTMMKKHRIVTFHSYTPAARFISNFFRNVVLPIISNFGIIVHHLHQTHQSSDNGWTWFIVWTLMRLIKMMNYDEETSYCNHSQLYTKSTIYKQFFRNVVLPIIRNFGIIVHHLHQTHQSSDNGWTWFIVWTLMRLIKMMNYDEETSYCNLSQLYTRSTIYKQFFQKRCVANN